MSLSSRPRQGGFTLIEIMVVIVILGILAALVVPNFSGQTAKAAITAAKTDLRAIESALEFYNQDKFRYPTTEEGLESLVPDYIKRLPKDPWKNTYVYLSPGLKGDYDLYSLGADGQQGGEGKNADVGNWDL